MSETDNQSGGQAYVPSEEIRYDLNGNPLPAQPRSGSSAAPPPPPPTAYAPPPPAPAPAYAPPPSPYGYGAPPGGGYPQGQNPPPVYGQPGGAVYGGPTAAQPKSKVGVFVGVGVAFLVVLISLIAYKISKPEMVTAPASYAQFNSPDKSFSCTGPQGWEFVGSGMEGSQVGGVLFKKGSVKIDITSSDALSFLGDAMKSPAPMIDVPGMPPPPPPVEKIHAMEKGTLSGKYGDYVEQAAQPLQVPFGDTRISEWTAKAGMFGGTLHGYRVTMLGLNKAITIDCHCPDQDWDTMKPVFLKVIQSIVPGNG